MFQKLTYFDASHAADAVTVAFPVAGSAAGLVVTFAWTRSSRLRGVLQSWTCRMIHVRASSIACSHQPLPIRRVE